MAAPVLGRLADEMDLHFVKVNVTRPENEWLLRALNLRQTPTVWAFIDGKAVQPPVVGFLGEEGYRDVFERIVAFAENRRAEPSS